MDRRMQGTHDAGSLAEIFDFDFDFEFYSDTPDVPQLAIRKVLLDRSFEEKDY